MKSSSCPICGYLDITILDEHGYPTFEICECCGNEAGYQYDHKTKESQLVTLRSIWLDSKPKEKPWLDGKPLKPIDETGTLLQKIEQLRRAGMTVPEE